MLMLRLCFDVVTLELLFLVLQFCSDVNIEALI